VRNEGPKPMTNNKTCKASVSAGSRHDKARKRLQKSSTVPLRRRYASSPIGLSISGGPKRELTS
jgi:hypothetical protein